MQNDNSIYLEFLDDVAYILRIYGAHNILKDFKVLYPKIYNELLLAALEQLPK